MRKYKVYLLIKQKYENISARGSFNPAFFIPFFLCIGMICQFLLNIKNPQRIEVLYTGHYVYLTSETAILLRVLFPVQEELWSYSILP